MSFQNVNPFIGTIISETKATLIELKTVYSLEDAFILWEIIAVKKHNEFLAHQESIKAAKERSRRK